MKSLKIVSKSNHSYCTPVGKKKIILQEMFISRNKVMHLTAIRRICSVTRTHAQAGRQTGRQAGRQEGRQAGRQTDRQTQTDTDRQTQTDKETDR